MRPTAHGAPTPLPAFRPLSAPVVALALLIELPLGGIALLLGGCSGSSTSPQAVQDATSAHTFFVRSDAPSGGDGLSWAHAFRDPQHAIDTARAGDTIWVGTGTFRPAPPNGDRAASFVLKSGVALYGGFAGDEQSLDQRSFLWNPTILSGDLNGDDGDDSGTGYDGPPADAAVRGSSAENSYHVVVAFDPAPTTLLDGLTIRAGRADGPSAADPRQSHDQGSGLDIFGGALVVRNCTIEHCYSSDHGAANDQGLATTFANCTFQSCRAVVLGAGLYVDRNAASTVLDCMFVADDTPGDGGGTYCRSNTGARFEGCMWCTNHANRGAGLFCAQRSTPYVRGGEFALNSADLGGGGMFDEESSPIIEACTFVENQAGVDITDGGGGGGGSGGGGIWNNTDTALVVNCVFRGNAASFGGGVYDILDSRAEILGCEFSDNHANEAGGLYTLNSPVRVLDCTFSRNVAQGSLFSVGGGMSNYFSNSFVDGCTFRGNRAELGGGGLYNEGEAPREQRCTFEGNEAFGVSQGWGGGILNGYNTRASIVSCAFAANAARKGGGIFNLFLSAPSIVNCTLAANRAFLRGGGTYEYFGTAAVYDNCIVWGSNDEMGGDMAGDLVATFRYGCIHGLDNGGGGAGVIDVDPVFVRAPSPGADGVWGTSDDDFGDLHLAGGSPCADAAANRALPGDATIDRDGNPRCADDPGALDVGLGLAPIVDMGAYERP
jgi:hypothetical protein